MILHLLYTAILKDLRDVFFFLPSLIIIPFSPSQILEVDGTTKVGRYCGTTRPPPMRSSTNTIIVTFHSRSGGGNVSGDVGFEVEWTTGGEGEGDLIEGLYSMRPELIIQFTLSEILWYTNFDILKMLKLPKSMVSVGSY